jgi:hypothetical protein
VAKARQHPANLAILTFGQDQFEHVRLTLAAQESSPLGADLTFRKPNTRGQLGHDILVGSAGYQSAIELLDAVTRMSEPICQLAVVRQDHQSSTILVEAADCINALGQFWEEIDDAGSAGGIEIGGNIAFGLVNGEVHHRLEVDRFAVDGDARSSGVNPRAQLADNLSVDRNAPLPD